MGRLTKPRLDVLVARARGCGGEICAFVWCRADPRCFGLRDAEGKIDHLGGFGRFRRGKWERENEGLNREASGMNRST